MKTRLQLISTSKLNQLCTMPEIGQLVGDFVVELLNESAGEEVEGHLLDCGYCRIRYLKMLSLLNMAPTYDTTARQSLTASKERDIRDRATKLSALEFSFVSLTRWRSIDDANEEPEEGANLVQKELRIGDGADSPVRTR